MVKGIALILAALPALKTLSLSGCLLSPVGATALAGGEERTNEQARVGVAGHPNLAFLDLSKNRIGLCGAAAVIDAASPVLAQLSFFGNRIGDTTEHRRDCTAVGLLGKILESQRRAIDGQVSCGGGIGLTSLDLGGCNLTAATFLPMCELLRTEAACHRADSVSKCGYKLETLELLGNSHEGAAETALKALRAEFEDAREAIHATTPSEWEPICARRIINLDIVWTTSKE